MSKATPEKTAAKKAAGTENGNSKLTGTEYKILKALQGTSAINAPTKSVIEKKSGCNRIPACIVGAGTREGMGVHGANTLAGRGLIRIVQHEGSRNLGYYITAKGTAAVKSK